MSSSLRSYEVYETVQNILSVPLLIRQSCLDMEGMGTGLNEG